MDILTTNIKCLKRYHPNVERKLRDSEESGNVEAIHSKNNLFSLKVNGILLHSAYDPVEEAVKTVSLFDSGDSDTIIVLGLGLAYHVDELLKKGKKLIVVEPSWEVFRVALGHRDFSSLIGHFDFRIGENPFALALDLSAREKGALFIHRGTSRVWSEYCNRFVETFKAVKQLCRLRILVVGPIYGGSLPTARYVAACLETMGHDVDFVDCSMFADSYFKIDNITNKAGNRGIVQKKYIDFLEEAIIARAVDFEPDIVLALAQAPLSPKAINRLKQSEVPVAFWFVEDFRILEYWKEVAPCYDYFFSIQRGEFFDSLFRAGVRNFTYLPQGCYPPVHKEIKLSADENDRYGSEISLVGAGYYNRQQFLKGMTDFDLKIWGSGWTLNSPLGSFIQEKSQRLLPEEYVKVFNATPVNINLHSSTFHEGVDPAGDFVNPRTFELASCGAFQLVDNRSELGELFEIGSEIICYENLTDLREKCHYYLERPQEREKISQKSRERALRDHTIESRLTVMLVTIFVNDQDKIVSRIEEREKRSRVMVNRIDHMIEEAGKDSELGRFLGAFSKSESLTPNKVMEKIEKGTGPVSKVETIFMMINEILT